MRNLRFSKTKGKVFVQRNCVLRLALMYNKGADYIREPIQNPLDLRDAGYTLNPFDAQLHCRNMDERGGIMSQSGQIYPVVWIKLRFGTSPKVHGNQTTSLTTL